MCNLKWEIWTICKQYVKCLFFLFVSIRRSPAATTQPPITKVCLPGKKPPGIFCFVKLCRILFISGSDICLPQFYFIFPPLLSLTSPLVLDFFSWICLRDHFHCFAFCLQPLHCSSDYFVIRLINLVQTQFKIRFRQTPMHIQALAQWGLLQQLAQKITAKLPFHLSLNFILNSCLSVVVLSFCGRLHI